MRQLIIVLFCVFATPAHAAKFYKWVDEQGIVHLSKSQAAVQGMAAARTAATIEPAPLGSGLYCGSVALPGKTSNLVNYIGKLNMEIRSSEETLHSLHEQLQQLADSPAQHSEMDKQAKLEKSVAEHQCRVDWMSKELAWAYRERDKAGKPASAYAGELERLKRDKVAECGPDRHSAELVMDNEYRRYHDCVQRFDQDIGRLEAKLHTANN